jgi:hypothetical protein
MESLTGYRGRAELIADPLDQDEAALLGNSPRRHVLDMAPQLDALEAQLARPPVNQCDECARGEALSSQLARDQVGDFGPALSELGR